MVNVGPGSGKQHKANPGQEVAQFFHFIITVFFFKFVSYHLVT